MSFRRRCIACLLIVLSCSLSGCIFKLALDTPSKPLEEFAAGRRRVARCRQRHGRFHPYGLEGSSAEPTPDLGTIYHRAAKISDRDCNPVIVIPGILGSRLVDTKTDKIVWGEFGGAGISLKTAEGARQFAIPMNPEQLATFPQPCVPMACSIRSNCMSSACRFNSRRAGRFWNRFVGGYLDLEARRQTTGGVGQPCDQF